MSGTATNADLHETLLLFSNLGPPLTKRWGERKSTEKYNKACDIDSELLGPVRNIKNNFGIIIRGEFCSIGNLLFSKFFH